MIVHTLHPDCTRVIGGPEPEGFVARFVDSVNGDDDNDGTTAATAFATIAAATAEELTSSTYLLLATDSRFREEVTGLPTGVKIRSYGYGARPIIDGRDIAVNASFSKTGGRTNVYEIAWTHEFAADGGKSAHRVWEAGSMLTRAASLAACDSTPGSFYAGAPTTSGPDTIYVHPAGSTSAITNGLQYAITKRRWCVQLYNEYNQAHITGIETIGNSYADGSLCIDGYAENCIARDGRIHNAFILGEAYNCQALSIESGVVSTMFVSYCDSTNFGGPSSRNVLYRSCTADAQATMESVNGFYVHTDGVREFGTIEYRDCRAVGVEAGWGGIQTQKFVTYRCTYENVRNAYSLYGSQGNYFLGGTGKVRAGAFNGGLVYIDVSGIALDFVVHGCKMYAPGSFNPVYVIAPESSLLFERNTFAIAGGTCLFARGDVTLHKNVWRGDLVCAAIGQSGHQVDGFNTDDNCYWHTGISDGAFQQLFPSAAYILSLSAWRTYLDGIDVGLEQDANSIAQDPLLTDPVNLDFTIGNATVLSMGAGAEVDEEDDAELQAYWLANRVTEV